MVLIFGLKIFGSTLKSLYWRHDSHLLMRT